MAQLQLKGSVIHQAGVWGSLVAAAGVTVEIIQHHLASTKKTTIWTGVTDSSGRFQGQSSEWRRMRTITLGPVTKTEPDPTDVLALTAHVFDASGGGRDVTLPFAWLGDFLPTPPLIAGWEPPMARKGSVNGATCYSYADIISRAAAVVQSQQRLCVDIRTFGARVHSDLVRLKSYGDGIAPSIMARAAAIAANTSIVLTNRTPQQQQTLRNLVDAIRAARPPMPRPAGGMTAATPAIAASGGSRHVSGIAAGQPLIGTVTENEAVYVAIAEALLAAGILIVLGPGLAMAACIAAIVLAVLAIIQSMPALLNAIAALFTALGLTGIAQELTAASGWWAANLTGPFAAATAVLCIVLAILLTGVAALVSIAVTPGEEALRIITG